ncbi:MAG: UDP-N-acetylglucosamine--N-acetylmuramyl-(pentapeptide) pyrophosphoryl-undecaprenol N-acetylglucosamine transferase [Patescibacteria group bacterium]|nr:UDP-N-acetylglucosamine--N-acetylmuramyl-(pentapeptide) pyrophosphoryl-undecaprenol N-acetylglucosamine transferase [Patescibacteria group bacterium]
MNKKIILSGGGTGGSVTPLLQIYKEFKYEFNFLFIGTYRGIERDLVKKEAIEYRAISSGKLRRYFSLLNFIDIFKIFIAFWQSLILLKKEKPDLIISAGGFVAVPLSIASWFWRIPIIVHQQDVVPGLANRIMARFAKVVTVTFESSLCDYGNKARWIGNLGPDLKNFSADRDDILKKYNIKKSHLPLMLVVGGGTGSSFINQLISQSIEDLLIFTRVFHVSGKIDRSDDKKIINNNYQKIDFIYHQDLLNLMLESDLVVSRCGLGALTELSFFKKPAILIPMPNSHQEENAKEFAKLKSAKILEENTLRPDIFINEVKNILNNPDLKKRLSENISLVIKNGNKEMMNIIKEILN